MHHSGHIYSSPPDIDRREAQKTKTKAKVCSSPQIKCSPYKNDLIVLPAASA